jgi:hypothetical protein
MEKDYKTIKTMKAAVKNMNNTKNYSGSILIKTSNKNNEVQLLKLIKPSSFHVLDEYLDYVEYDTVKWCFKTRTWRQTEKEFLHGDEIEADYVDRGYKGILEAANTNAKNLEFLLSNNIITICEIHERLKIKDL